MRVVGFGPVGMTDDDIFAVAARVVIARNRNDAVARIGAPYQLPE